MGLSSITNRVAYVGDGTSTIFSYPYYFFNQADLKVYLFDINSSVVFPQAVGTNYTISGTANAQGVFPSGGNVIMNSAFPSYLDLIITRSPSPVQNYVLNQNGPINSIALVQAFDYLTAITQRLQEEVSRCIQLPDGLGPINGSSFNPTLPSTISGPAFAANVPIVVNSGATGLTFGVVVSASSGVVSYVGTLPVVNGGTGQSTALTQFALWYSLNATTMAQLPVGPLNQVLTGTGAGAPTWSNLILGSSVILGSSTTTSGNTIGILPVTSGGTGTGSSFNYAQWGVVYSSSANQFASIAPTTPGLVLSTQGSSAPTFSQINLASSAALTGILSVSSGGTGISTNPSYTQFGVIYASSATQLTTTPTPGVGLVLVGNGSSAPSFQSISVVVTNVAPTVQRFLTGSSIGTYSKPISPSPLYLEVVMVGGGGGGGASGVGGGAGGTGGATIFGPMTAGGGMGGTGAGSTTGGGGGSSAIGTGIGINVSGGGGDPSGGSTATAQASSGAASALGGGGKVVASSTGLPGAANTGAGGAGGDSAAGGVTGVGSGGGSGGYIKAVIVTSAATLSYQVGSGGISGAGGNADGGAGGTGGIWVFEHYQ